MQKVWILDHIKPKKRVSLIFTLQTRAATMTWLNYQWCRTNSLFGKISYSHWHSEQFLSGLVQGMKVLLAARYAIKRGFFDFKTLIFEMFTLNFQFIGRRFLCRIEGSSFDVKKNQLFLASKNGSVITFLVFKWQLEIFI